MGNAKLELRYYFDLMSRSSELFDFNRMVGNPPVEIDRIW